MARFTRQILPDLRNAIGGTPGFRLASSVIFVFFDRRIEPPIGKTLATLWARSVEGRQCPFDPALGLESTQLERLRLPPLRLPQSSVLERSRTSSYEESALPLETGIGGDRFVLNFVLHFEKIPFGEAGQAEAWRSNGSFFSERENQDL